MALLDINNLHTYYKTPQGYAEAVKGVSLTLEENETLGVVGESGSGKTTLGQSILRILPDNASIETGSIVLNGTDLTKLNYNEMNNHRWNDISMIPQSAMDSLDPVYTIEDQITEVMRHHHGVKKQEARERAEELFELVNLDTERLDNYPHQFSGGMKQRALIALSLVLDPEIVIADEPTTALDVITQHNILNKIDDLREKQNLSMILISHDISTIAERTDKIAVMYGGRLVEFGETDEVINDPKHPYTIGLKNAFPTLGKKVDDLIAISGSPPNLIDPPEQCRFADRCPFAISQCFNVMPELDEIEEGRFADCLRIGDEGLNMQARQHWSQTNDDE